MDDPFELDVKLKEKEKQTKKFITKQKLKTENEI